MRLYLVKLGLLALFGVAHAQATDTIYYKFNSGRYDYSNLNGRKCLIDTFNNTKKICTFINGKEVGLWQYYKRDYLLKKEYLSSEVYFTSGPYKIQKEYYPSEVLKSLGYFGNGVYDGLLIDFHENSKVKKYSYYDKGELLETQEFTEYGIKISECIYPALDSSRFTCANSGDLYEMIVPVIYDDVAFMGDQWYKDGSVKVVCRLTPLDTIHCVSFNYFNKEGQVLISGKYTYGCNDNHYCRWNRYDTWNWYDKSGKLLEEKKYKLRLDEIKW